MTWDRIFAAAVLAVAALLAVAVNVAPYLRDSGDLDDANGGRDRDDNATGRHIDRRA